MELYKSYSKRLFWIVTIFSILTAVGVLAALYLGIMQYSIHFPDGIGQDTAVRITDWLSQQARLISAQYYRIILPSVFFFFLLVGWLIWLILKISMSGTFTRIQASLEEKQVPRRKKKDFIDQRIEQDRKRRLYLHALSVCQREGRLLDFFDEDLNEYDDEQIGAAARSIQEDCKKVVKKYINPRPVIEKEEGEPITVEKDFDIDAVKLIGNVSGEPPFEGIVTHRGWKAGKRDIPKLSDIQDSTIITPAEVEIQ
ncbi:MAG: DUF2760 domain-containing protein [Desulfobacterales bacterium]|nr:DUF2760 domain-containing protein [Desulfobacterales bacterium]